jgi:hypothetical protein
MRFSFVAGFSQARRVAQARPESGMNRRAALRRTLVGLAAWPALPLPAQGAVLRVGPGGDVARFAQAIALASDGDQLQILPGDYLGDVAVIHQKRLDIVGIGQQPVFHGDGRHAEGKALWVVRSGDIRIENIAFRGARVPDGNGAGIRFERGRLRLHRCSFADNEMGLLSGNDGSAVLAISDCEFADAPPGQRMLHHLLYVGRIGAFSITGSRLRRGHVGHLIKSRAGRSLITYNCIVDGADGNASYEIDLPNGGDATLIGNLIGQSARTENPALLSFGAEGAPWPQSRLRLAHNTFVSDLAVGTRFVQAWHDRMPDALGVVALNNLLLGDGELLLGPGARAEGNVALPRAALGEAEQASCVLASDAPWRGRAAALAGDDASLRPTAQFELPLGTRTLRHVARWSPGALQE